MFLKDGARHSFTHLAFDKAIDGFGFVLASGDENDLLGFHDGSKAHRDGAGWDFADIVEETGIVLDGLLGKLSLMGKGIKWGAWLVESDMAIASDTKDLDVDSASVFDLFVVAVHVGFVITNAKKDVGVLFLDVDMLEEILSHEISV